MAKYDYHSNKDFVELVRKCYLGCVDKIYTAEGYNREDALGIIGGMTIMAKSLICEIEEDKDKE